jgi:hypothetical protein
LEPRNFAASAAFLSHVAVAWNFLSEKMGGEIKHAMLFLRGREEAQFGFG